MKHVCPYCKLEKEKVGPKIISRGYIKDDKLSDPALTLFTKVMCEDCLNLYKNGSLEI